MNKMSKELFDAPSNPNISVWRYMDFTKFVSMLSNSSIYFPSADCLGDHWEGSFGLLNLNSNLGRPIISARPVDLGHIRSHNTQRKLWRKYIQNLRRSIFISCWHMGEQESAGMWKLYAEEKNSVCIQSTYSLMRESFGLSVPKIYIGEVNYVDYSTTVIPGELKDPFASFLFKRKSFEHEREIRAIFSLSRMIVDEKTRVYGYHVQVDLTKLVEKIYIAPTAPAWYFDVVKSLVSKYGLNPNIVIQSNLLKDPIW